MPHNPADLDDGRPRKWWLVSWSTYGTWLPGDPRGYRTWRGKRHVPPPKRYAAPGEATYEPAPHRELLALARKSMNEEPVFLSPDERRTAAEAMREEFELIPVEPSILAVAEWHVHVLVRVGGYPLRTAAGRLRAAATRLLHIRGTPGRKVWCQGCDLESKNDDSAIETAFRYVERHDAQGACVDIWDHPLSERFRHLPR